MKVFISWSGDLSKRVAEVLKEWIPRVLQNAEPWISTSCIEKGAQSFDEISSNLSAVTVGVLCVTRDNMTAPWLLFEAGALAKGLSKSRVCPLLIDAESPSELIPPLSNFQATMPIKEDVTKLMKTINASDPDKKILDHRVEDAVEHWWPKFESSFESARKAGPVSQAPKRTQEDMTKEILTTLRMLYAKIPDFQVTEMSVCDSGGGTDTFNVLTVSDEFAALRDFGKAS